MALTYGFYNSIEGDRVYDAIQFGRIFDGIIKDGVYATYEKGMMVIASSNPGEVIIQPGRAWFNHTWSYNDANVIFEAPAPEVLLERYDALVLEINEELSSRENSYKWVTGTPSSRPERPTLTNTTTIHQYPLCYVHRYPETTMIYTRDITNMIGTSECPFATGVLEGIDLDAWINQWDDEFHTWENSKKTQFEAWMLSQETAFTTWYNAFKDQMASDVQEVEDFVDYLESVLDESTAIHLQEEIDELRNEISSGSHITVTTINPELYGRNVTITEAGGTVFTEKFDNTGVAVFKSVPYVGNLTISSTYGTQTAERVVNTPYYARYEFAIAFWAATVNIVGDPEMAGSSVTVKDSEEAIVGTVVLDSEGTGVYTAIKPDTYKFTLTYGGQTMEVTLSVTQETTYTVDLHADRFRWENWVDASKTLHSTDYDSLDEVLADEKAVRELMTIHACVDYLANIDDEDEDVKTIIENDLCAKWINLRDYALDTLYANTVIKEYMDHSLVELKPQVPTMTSNTTPSGVASASLEGSGDHYAWHAFDKSDSTFWGAGVTTLPQTVYYEFTNSIKLSAFSYKAYSYNNAAKDVAIVDANGNELETVTLENTADEQYIKLSGIYTGAKFGLKIKTTYNGVGASAKELQFYAHEYSSKYFFGEWCLMPQVPTMTSNTAPYGEALGTQNSGNENYKAFDGNDSIYTASASSTGWTGYKFTSPVCVKRVSFIPYAGRVQTYTIDASNDGNTWTPLTDALTCPNSGDKQVVNINNNNYYLMYRLNCTSTYGSNYVLYTLQFYAYAPKGNVPIMTSNTAPYGEVSASATVQTYYPYNLFDNNDSTIWIGASSVTGQWVKYKFTNPMCAKRVKLKIVTNAGHDINPIIKGSNDDTTYTDLGTFSTISTAGEFSKDLEIDNYYLYYMVYFPEIINVTNSWVITFSTLQFYGRELSVSVPTMTSDTTPYGEAFADSTAGGSLWQAFDKDGSTPWASGGNYGYGNNYIGYKFGHKVRLGFVSVIGAKYGNETKARVKTIKVQGSNDGNTWVDVENGKEFILNEDTSITCYSINDATSYDMYRITCKDGWNAIGVAYREIQFYGFDYSEKEFEEGTTKKWLYDHGVEPNEHRINKGTDASQIYEERNGSSLYEYVNPNNRSCMIAWRLDTTLFDALWGQVINMNSTAVQQLRVEQTSGTGIGMATPSMGDMPHVPTKLDISAVDQEVDVGFMCTYGPNYIEFNELWLE